MMKSLNRSLLTAGLALVSFATAGTAQATLLTYTGSAAISTSLDPAAIAVGDVFHFTFTYDDQVVDWAGASGGGGFTNALTAFELTSDPTNTGTLNLVGVTYTLPVPVFTNESLSPETFSGKAFVDDPAGASFSGEPLQAASVQFHSFNTDFINDTGTGQTLDQLLAGPLRTDLAYYSTAAIVLETDEFSESAVITSLVLVPEPSSLAILGLLAVSVSGRGGRVMARRRRNTMP